MMLVAGSASSSSPLFVGTPRFSCILCGYEGYAAAAASDTFADQLATNCTYRSAWISLRSGAGSFRNGSMNRTAPPKRPDQTTYPRSRTALQGSRQNKIMEFCSIVLKNKIVELNHHLLLLLARELGFGNMN